MDGIFRRPPIPRAPEHGGGAGQGGRGDGSGSGSGAHPVAPPRSARPLVPGIPSRVVDPSGVVKHQTRGPAGGPGSASTTTETRGQLVVGRDIAFKGEIGACERLVVHGDVEARLSARSLEVGAEGRFRGSVDVETADIAGRFQGTLTVRGVLTLRDGGRVEGTVRYDQLVVERGGQLAGDVDTRDAAAPHTDRPPAPAAAGEADAAQNATDRTATEQSATAERTGAGQDPAGHDPAASDEPAEPAPARDQAAAAAPTSSPAPTSPSAATPEAASEAGPPPETPRAPPASGREDRAAGDAAEPADIPVPPRRGGEGAERRLFRHGDRARRLREYAERDL